MKEHISIETAIKNAQRRITFPTMSVMLGTMVASCLLGTRGLIPIGLMVPALFMGMLLGWLGWAIQVPKWKVWAYARVEDLEALKAEAVRSSIIWKDSSLFTKTEIWTPSAKNKMREILDSK